MDQPSLTTERLVLRPFRSEDADALTAVVNDPLIAANTLSIPHPYPDGMAAEWIAGHAAAFEAGRAAVFAVTEAAGGALCGASGLHLDAVHRRAELGYWIAAEKRGRGYATEAGRALIAYGFEELGLERIHAAHYPHNPASGRVLEKLGMRREGVLRGHVRKGEQRLDFVFYGRLRDDPV